MIEVIECGISKCGVCKQAPHCFDSKLTETMAIHELMDMESFETYLTKAIKYKFGLDEHIPEETIEYNEGFDWLDDVFDERKG